MSEFDDQIDRSILEIMTDAMAGAAGASKELSLKISALQRDLNRLSGILSAVPEYIIEEEPG